MFEKYGFLQSNEKGFCLFDGGKFCILDRNDENKPTDIGIVKYHVTESFNKFNVIKAERIHPEIPMGEDIKKLDLSKFDFDGDSMWFEQRLMGRESKDYVLYVHSEHNYILEEAIYAKVDGDMHLIAYFNSSDDYTRESTSARKIIEYIRLYSTDVTENMFSAKAKGYIMERAKTFIEPVFDKPLAMEKMGQVFYPYTNVNTVDCTVYDNKLCELSLCDVWKNINHVYFIKFHSGMKEYRYDFPLVKEMRKEAKEKFTITFEEFVNYLIENGMAYSGNSQYGDLMITKHIELFGNKYDLTLFNAYKRFNEDEDVQDYQIKYVKDSIEKYQEWYKSLAKKCGMKNINVLRNYTLRNVLLGLAK